jgi:mannose-6-phosphate isomerase-like protein (cupin superfamily)
MKGNFLAHLAALPQPANTSYPQGTPFVHALAHGSMRVELFAPATSGLGKDIQQPHGQDELYVVQRGQSDFLLAQQTISVGPGDVVFVPAGAPHRFENFSADFVTWVIFYGPAGGESTCP